MSSDLTDSQTRALLVSGSQEPLPLLISKHQDDDIFQDLSQQKTTDASEMSSSQKSLLGVFEGIGPLDTVEAEQLFPSGTSFRRTRSSRRIAQKRAQRSEYVCEEPALPIYDDPTLYNEQVYGSADMVQPKLTVIVQEQAKTRNLDYTIHQNTIYAKWHVYIPFQIMFPNEYSDSNAMLVVYAQYDDPTLKETPVMRCPVHANSDQQVYSRNYFLQTDNKEANYSTEQNFYAISVPLCNFLNLKMTCYSSCAGGVNRRPISLIFCVQHPSLPDISCNISVRSCANPSRDAAKDLKELKAEHSKKSSNFSFADIKTPVSEIKSRKRSLPLPQQKRFTELEQSEDGVYPIMVHGYSKYVKVLRYLENLEVTERYLSAKETIGEPNLLAQLSQLTYDSRIRNWLDEVAMGEFAQAFTKRGIETMGELCDSYTPTIFLDVGMSESMANHVNKAFLNWRNVFESRNSCA